MTLASETHRARPAALYATKKKRRVAVRRVSLYFKKTLWSSPPAASRDLCFSQTHKTEWCVRRDSLLCGTGGTSQSWLCAYPPDHNRRSHRCNGQFNSHEENNPLSPAVRIVVHRVLQCVSWFTESYHCSHIRPPKCSQSAPRAKKNCARSYCRGLPLPPIPLPPNSTSLLTRAAWLHVAWLHRDNGGLTAYGLG